MRIQEEGASNWHYRGRDENPSESEARFQIVEVGYSDLVKQVQRTKTLPKWGQAVIIHALLQLHFRNPGYNNRTGLNNFDLFQSMTSLMLMRRSGASRTTFRPTSAPPRLPFSLSSSSCGG